MKIRPIQEDDLPEVFAVRVATWHNAYGAEELTQMGITTASVANLMKTTHRGWLAEDVTGKVVGFAMGNRANGEMWVIAVLKVFEGQGIGRRLLAQVEQWLFEHDWQEIWLTTDPDETMRAVGFYRHLGWEDWKMQDGDRFMRKQRSS